MRKSPSSLLKHTAILAICSISSSCAISDQINKNIAQNKRTLVPFPIEFSLISEKDAAEILDKGKSVEDNLSDIFASNVVDIVAAQMQMCEQGKCEGNLNISRSQELAKMPIARPDLNKDGKKDLVINITQNTGLGNCGAAEYRFYENTGADFRPLGTAKVTRIQTLYEIDDARRGQFKTLMWRAKFDCENKPIDSQESQTYDKAKQLYYSID